MVKVRNQAVFIWLLVAACLAPPALAHSSRWDWLAQAVDSPDATAPETVPDAAPASEVEGPVDTVETVPDPAGDPAEAVPVPDAVPPAAAEGAPPELAPTFVLPAQLPADSAITIAGSPSMTVIAQALMQRFQETFAETTVNLVEQPSDRALADLLAGTVDLAAIGRPLQDAEKAQGLTAIPVSREKIAIIVGQANPFAGDLEAEDFVRIFRGEITNWSELGGPDLPIRLIDRPANSDTRQSLGTYEIFAGELTTGANAITVDADSTAAVVRELGDNGISYAIASQVANQDNVRALSMHGTTPDDPRYPYSQPRNLVYRNTDELPAATEAFLALATNAEGQAVVATAKAAEAADVAAAELRDSVVAMRPQAPGFVTGDRQGNLNFWNADGTSAGDPVSAHTGPVTALAFGSDGQRLISGGADGTIRFWDAIGNSVGEPINAGNGPVTSLVVQPDGSFISANADGTLQRWDDFGNPVGEPIPGHTDIVYDLALTPDGQTLISASKDGTVQLWNPADGAAKGAPITEHQGAVQAIAVQPDGSFVTGGADGTVRQWDSTGASLGQPIQVAGPVNALATNPEGSQIAVGDDTGTLQRLNADGTPAVAAVTDIGAPVADLAYTPTGEQLIVSAGTAPQLRDRAGQLVPIPTAELPTPTDETAVSGLPPELLDLWQRLQRLPPWVLWMIPVAALALLLLGLLRSFQREEAEEDEAAAIAAPPPPDLEAFDAPSGTAVIAGITPEEASNSLDPSLTKARQALSDGTHLAKAGRYQEALDSLNQAIEAADLERLKAVAAGVGLAGAGTLIARSLARRGAVLANLGRSDEALQGYNRALELDPNDLTAWIGKGNALMQTGHLDEAVFCFDKAIALNPNVSSAWQGKGYALQKMGHEAEARNCFAKAQSLSGNPDEIPLDPGLPGDRDRIEVPPEGEVAFPVAPDSSADNGVRPVEPTEATFPIAPDSPTADADADRPTDLQAAIAALPTVSEEPAPQAEWAAPVAVPPEGSAIDTSGEVAMLDVPPEVQAAVEGLPEEPDKPDPQAPIAAPVEVPPEVDEILAGQSDLPSTEAAIAPAAIADPQASPHLEDTMTLAGPASPAPTATPEPATPPPAAAANRPETAAIPDQPESEPAYDPALADLPPEILEALKSIPEDSDDSFMLPPTPPKKRAVPPPPPPPPSNPRLRRPPS